MMEQRVGQQKFSPNSQHPNKNNQVIKKVVSMDAKQLKIPPVGPFELRAI